MNIADSDSAMPSVKLYPRLATRNPEVEPKNARRKHARQRQTAADDDRRDAARSNIRARLLRMIVENERVRRHEHRPSAS
jgi:hypothetical protein